MKISALLLGVCHPQKLDWIDTTLRSLDSAPKFKFDRMVLAIDEFFKFKWPTANNQKFADRGWTIIRDSHTSRPKSMVHGLKHITEDWVFYHEDDVVVNLPEREKIEEILNAKSPDGRTCGMASLTLGGTMAWFSTGFGVGDLGRANKNKIIGWDDIFSFRREEETRDKHFFEFPGLFIKRDVLVECLKYSMINCKNTQIEQALTRAWFETGQDKKFYKCSIAKTNLPHIIETNHKAVFEQCRLLSNLDPFQGNSPYFGSHHV